MEVAHQDDDTGKIMCVHSCWSVGPFSRQSNMSFWMDGKIPKFGTVCFYPSSKKDIVFWGKCCTCLLFKYYAVVVVAKWTNDHQIMMKIWHAVSSEYGEVIVQ